MLTPAMRTQLVDAIKQANGTHEYLNKAETVTPRCVVGCLASNVGVSLDALKQWDRAAGSSCAIETLFTKYDDRPEGVDAPPEVDKLLPFRGEFIPEEQRAAWLEAFNDGAIGVYVYPSDFDSSIMVVLQYCWDNSKGSDEVRAKLIELVSKLPVAEG
jgi:hypothetical protein